LGVREVGREVGPGVVGVVAMVGVIGEVEKAW